MHAKLKKFGISISNIVSRKCLQMHGMVAHIIKTKTLFKETRNKIIYILLKNVRTNNY